MGAYTTTSGHVVLLDDDVIESLPNRISVGSHGYAQMWLGQSVVLLHRWILGLVVGDIRQGDHINRDKLDNRRANLRIVTPAENGQNTKPRTALSGRPTRSRFRGVSRDAAGRWIAYGQLHGRRHHVGAFDTEQQAAAAARAWRAAHMTHATD